ncbi:MAG: hypothetical protein FJZ04_02400 [Candidatus Moranbacteria bacterium]|nr:hypothetical protein [Candidatus Moranbacteria bacterium]
MDTVTQGKLFIVTGAEGSGKTSVIAELAKVFSFYQVTYLSTRAVPEKGTVVAKWDKFKDLAEKDQFILSYQKKDYLTGATHEEIAKAEKSGLPIVWEIDIKYFEGIKNEFPEAKVILINGVGFEGFYEHLKSSGQTVPAAMALQAKRSAAQNKMLHQSVDFVVENRKGESAKAAERIKEIITKSQVRT